MSCSSDSGSSMPPLKEGYIRITEGTATMDYDEKEAVFYNKVQVFNRDTSIQVIKLFSEIREKEKQASRDAADAGREGLGLLMGLLVFIR